MNARWASFFVAAWLLSSGSAWSCHEGGPMGFADGKLDVDEERLVRRVADLIKIKDIEVLKLKHDVQS